jgi:kynurenine formamidase
MLLKAIATDALSIESFNGFNEGLKAGLNGNEDLIPNHFAFNEKRIPIFETLDNMGSRLDKEGIIFPVPFKVRRWKWFPP